MGDSGILERLGGFSTPTVCNAIEKLKLRRCDEGYTRHPVRCLADPGRAVAGYAVTALVRTTELPADPRRIQPSDWWDLLSKMPAPKVVVMKDVDFPESRGSFWGEIQGNIHRALGCVGIVTDGFIRDVTEMGRMGLLVLASGVTVSRCYPRLLSIGEPVNILGQTVKTGDLVHADYHGLVLVPEKNVEEIVSTAVTIEDGERQIVESCRPDTFSMERFKEVYRLHRR